MSNDRLFGDAPVRDERFVVKELREELDNFPADHPEFTREFLHRQMNEEVNGLEMSALNIAQFPDAPWELRMAMARQCADEARHVEMFRNCMERRGARVGQYPVMNFQYRIMSKIDALVGRLVVQNRSFEAAGIDAIQLEIVGRSQRAGDEDLLQLFDAQLADEVQHVRYANIWVKRLTEMAGPQALMQIIRAVHLAGEALKLVAGDALMFYPVDRELRKEAGFDETEITAAEQTVKSHA
jgi:uncharacterized ferritin-like protein (DUF455 family)